MANANAPISLVREIEGKPPTEIITYYKAAFESQVRQEAQRTAVVTYLSDNLSTLIGLGDTIVKMHLQCGKDLDGLKNSLAKYEQGLVAANARKLACAEAYGHARLVADEAQAKLTAEMSTEALEAAKLAKQKMTDTMEELENVGDYIVQLESYIRALHTNIEGLEDNLRRMEAHFLEATGKPIIERLEGEKRALEARIRPLQDALLEAEKRKEEQQMALRDAETIIAIRER